jgi:hypothetical protein
VYRSSFGFYEHVSVANVVDVVTCRLSCELTFIHDVVMAEGTVKEYSPTVGCPSG